MSTDHPPPYNPQSGPSAPSLPPDAGYPSNYPNPDQPTAPPYSAGSYASPDDYSALAGHTVGPVGPGYGTVYPATSTGGFDNPSFGQPETINAMEAGTGAESQWSGSSFSEKSIRQAFIRKVYLILMSQLAFTFTIVCVFSFYQPIKHWMQSGANQAVYWVSYAVFLVTYIILVCCPSVRRKVPGNYICLGIFTLALTYMTATLSSFHDTYIVVVAIGITAAVCLAISLFAIQTKIDFTMCSGLLFALLMVLMFFGFSILICYLITGSRFQLYVMNCVYGGLAALIFGLFLAYDTQLVIGGKRYQLSEEDYVEGALQLYIDVVYLFIIILGLFGSGNK